MKSQNRQLLSKAGLPFLGALLFCCRVSAMIPADAPMRLPAAVGAWKLDGPPRHVLPAAIFKYMDGAGELYLGYRFRSLDVYEYGAPSEETILVEIYRLESTEDAFGLLSGDWGGQAVDPGSEAPAPQDPAWLPSLRARYGAGLLRLCIDNFYARVMAYRETEASREAVLRLGRLIAAGRRGTPAPRLVLALPDSIGPAGGIRGSSVCFFRTHLVLNSLYFLSNDNILRLSRETEAATAAYGAAVGPVRGARLVIVRYPDGRKAMEARAGFEKAYLHSSTTTGSSPDPSAVRSRRIEDGWVAWAVRGAYLAIVFESPDREGAEGALPRIFERLSTREVFR